MIWRDHVVMRSDLPAEKGRRRQTLTVRVDSK